MAIRVAHSDNLATSPGIKVKMRSTKGFLGGVEKQFTGRLQLWTSTARRESPVEQLERLNSAMSTSSLTIRNRSQASVVSQAPILPPLSISQESINLPGLTRASTAASWSSTASPSRSSVASPSRSSVASPSRSSMASAFSAIPSEPTSPTVRPASVRTTKTTYTSSSDDVGIVIDMPDPPRLVFFLVDASGPQSLLVIDGNKSPSL